MNSKKYLPLLFLVATSALALQCAESYIPLNRTSFGRGAAAVEPYEVTLPVENDIYPIFPLKPIETEEGHMTYPTLEEGFEKPLPVDEEGIAKPLPVDEEEIILPRFDYEEEVDILPFEPRVHNESSKWHGDKKWRRKNKYGEANILPYPGDEEVSILPYPGNDEEVSILPYPQPGDEGYQKPEYEILPYIPEDGFVHGWEDQEVQNPGGMPEDLPEVELAKTA